MPRLLKPTEAKKETWFVIGIGGHIEEPSVEKYVFTTEDEEYDADEFKSFDEYVEYYIDEAIAEFEQRFARTIALKDDEVRSVVEELSALLI